MILEFKNKLNNDFSNFDEVYQKMLLKYKTDNTTRTEITFINEFTSEHNNDEICKKIWDKIKSKTNRIQWQLLDHYNHFLLTKRFVFKGILRKPFESKEYNKIENELSDYLKKYQYIFDKLPENIRKTFKPDVIDHLNEVLNFQKLSKYKNLFSDAISQVESNFDFYTNQFEKWEGYNLTQLLEYKNELKDSLKRAEQNVLYQYKQIEKQRERAKDGLANTLVFEHTELPKYESNLLKLKKEYSKIKIRIKTFEFSENKNTSQPNKIGKPEKLKKSLLEFIYNIEDKEAFMQELKKIFPTEQGKSIKAIVLQLVDAQILIYGTKEFSQFYTELKKYFNRSIGTYQSINDVKAVDTETTDTIYKKLNPLITKHKAI